MNSKSPTSNKNSRSRSVQAKSNDTNPGRWCLASERRLLQKLIHHKPAGINRQLNMVCLAIYMNNIFDFEEDINFEDYLNESDFELLKRRRQNNEVDPKNPMAFKPTYSIRPTVEEIERKLDEYFDLELIQENELLPEELSKEVNFDLSRFLSFHPGYDAHF